MSNFGDKVTNFWRSNVTGYDPKLPVARYTAQMNFGYKISDMKHFYEFASTRFYSCDAAKTFFKSALAGLSVTKTLLMYKVSLIKNEPDVHGNAYNLDKESILGSAFTTLKATLFGVMHLLGCVVVDSYKHYYKYKQNQAAFVRVDAQETFGKDGSLSVHNGSAIVPALNDITKKFDPALVYDTQDFHTEANISFAGNAAKLAEKEVKPFNDFLVETQGWFYNTYQKLTAWPVHGCQGKGVSSNYVNEGVDFLGGLTPAKPENIVTKGSEPNDDSFSGLRSNSGRYETPLFDKLRYQQVKTVYVAGLALNFCVAFTAEDLLSRGFNVVFVYDACRGIEIPGHMQATLDKLVNKGAKLMPTAAITDPNFDVTSISYKLKADYNHNDPTKPLPSAK